MSGWWIDTAIGVSAAGLMGAAAAMLRRGAQATEKHYRRLERRAASQREEMEAHQSILLALLKEWTPSKPSADEAEVLIRAYIRSMQDQETESSQSGEVRNDRG